MPDVATELQAASEIQFALAGAAWALGELYLRTVRDALAAQCDEGGSLFELAGAAVEELAEAYRVAPAAGDFTEEYYSCTLSHF